MGFYQNFRKVEAKANYVHDILEGGGDKLGQNRPKNQIPTQVNYTTEGHVHKKRQDVTFQIHEKTQFLLLKVRNLSDSHKIWWIIA